MNEWIDKILTAAAIPVLVIVGWGFIHFNRLMREANAEAERSKEEKPNNENQID
jgi:hypothetical protein